MKKLAVLLTIMALILATVPVSADSVTGFQYHGYLEDINGPVTDTCEFEFSLFDTASAGTQVGSTLSSDTVAVSDGWFWINLDFGDVYDGTALWLETSVTCDANPLQTLSPRQELGATPYALYSKTSPWAGLTGMPAGFADGVDDTATYTAGQGLAIVGTEIAVDFAVAQVRITGSCPSGQYMQSVNADGSVNCGVDADTDTNTTYTSGTGLSLTNTEFSVDYSLTQARIASACQSGYVMTGVNASGVPTCTVDIGGAHDINGAQHTGTPLGVTKGGTGTATQFTSGAVVFAGANGVYTQNASKFFFDTSNGALLLGTQTYTSPYLVDVINGSVRVVANSGYPGFHGFAFGTSAVPLFLLGRGRGTSSSPSAVQAGDGLGCLQFAGYGSSIARYTRSYICGNASENWTTGAQGNSLDFYVNKNGTSGEFLAMKIYNTGVAWFEKGVVSKDAVQATAYNIGNTSGTLTATGVTTSLTVLYDARVNSDNYVRYCSYVTMTITGGIITAVSSPTAFSECPAYIP